MKAAPKFKVGDSVIFATIINNHSTDVVNVGETFKIVNCYEDSFLKRRIYTGPKMENYFEEELEFPPIYHSPLFKALS